MSWSKLKQNLESFLCPALQGRVEFRASSYRYLPDKEGVVISRSIKRMSSI